MFDETLKLILAGSSRRPARSLPRRLDRQFVALACAANVKEASHIETLIWAEWMSHTDAAAEEQLEQATRAIATGDDDAETLLDALIAAYPAFAEAWNKRATLYFRQRRDAESVYDIGKTLELEPRHFGAICGFGQICLRHGDRAAALFVFDAALKINPHLQTVRAAVDKLTSERQGVAH